ncbi:D(1A) dopamine receptor-like [Montipora capricornis]|uniref:D(1A) dopamine receptor-like n=1 Tax=Montipora capricornis TaxID=246305 RepID=UPI0035F19757
MESWKGLDNQEGYTSNTSFKVTESEVQSEWTSTTIAITVFFAFLILLTSTGNLVVCRLVWVFRRMRIPSFCFVASMSISDFLMGVLVIPVSLGYHITYQTTGQWIFGKFSCNLWLFLNFLLCSASVYNLCVVSGDRYLAVTSPLKYLSLMNDHRIRNIIGISWLLAFVLAGFVTYGINVSKDNSDNCSIWGLRYEFSVTVLVVGYILPVSFLVFVNGKVYCIAHSHMNRIHAQEMSLASASHIAQAPSIVSIPETVRNNRRPARTRLKQEIKMFKTFLIVICAFLICWTPFVVILLIDSILTVPGVIRHSSILLLYFNSALNPFIYGYFNTEFRSALSGSLIRLVKRL